MISTEPIGDRDAAAAVGPAAPWQAAWLFGLLGVTFAAAGLGSAVTSTSLNDWYAALDKPAWNPPNWIFGPVWTTHYALMAIAAWLVYRRHGGKAAAGALALYGLQLALNVGWSAVFFGLRSPGLAFGEILLLLVAIVATLVAFWRHLWTLFAAYLNYSLWQLNA